MNLIPPSDPKRALMRAVASDATPAELAALSKSEFSFVRVRVAENPNVTADILSSIAPSAIDFSKSRGDFELACAVARNTQTRAGTLEQVLLTIPKKELDGSRRENRVWEELLLLLLGNPGMPDKTVLTFLEGANLSTSLKRKIARASASAIVLNVLGQDASGAVRAEVKKRRGHS